MLYCPIILDKVTFNENGKTGNNLRDVFYDCYTLTQASE